MQHLFRSQSPKFANVSTAIIITANLYKVPQETCVGHLRTVGYAAQVLQSDIRTAPAQHRVGDIGLGIPRPHRGPQGVGSRGRGQQRLTVNAVCRVMVTFAKQGGTGGT